MAYVKKETRRRQQWLRLTEEQIVKARPDLAGRLEWDDLIYAYNTHSTVKATAEAYIRNHPKED
jgi:hypothetical protein